MAIPVCALAAQSSQYQSRQVFVCAPSYADGDMISGAWMCCHDKLSGGVKLGLILVLMADDIIKKAREAAERYWYISGEA